MFDRIRLMQNGLFEICIFSYVLIGKGKVYIECRKDKAIRVGHKYVVNRAKMQRVEQKSNAYHFETRMYPTHNERNTDPMHLSNRSLEIQHRNANHYHAYEIRHQEHSSSIFEDQVRKPPECSKTNSNANDTQDVLPNVVVNVRIALVVSYLGGL